MHIAIMIEGQMGLTWPRWKAIAAAVEEAGFAGLFRSDHFTDPQPPNQESLEMVVSLAYLADRTARIHFGPCVAPVSFRDPVMLARQAAALDDLSGGRMVLGVGAGWQEREHHMFGYQLGDVATRMARFEEGLEVIHRLLRGEGPANYEGRFFRLRDAELLPRPQRPGGPPIMVGGNGMRRTLRLAARYADVWNGVFLSPAEFRARSAHLNELLAAAGRPASAVRRTLMTALFFGRDEGELDRRLSWRHEEDGFRGKSLAETVAALREGDRRVAGTTDAVVEQLRAYAAAGVEEILLQWFDLDDIDGLRGFAQAVLPRLDPDR
ncbi:MAG TPA: TIGR03560 family F420-dependent LLM class oxidoreductase [Roseiflexaceae bacterium]|nr:TIGR03560 family F420-dependent LLM class oxidoreductase [Roseiflexaceae bacterium]